MNPYSKLRALLLLSFISLTLTGYTQHLYPVSSSKAQWGLINENGQLVLDTIYDDCHYNPTYQWVTATKGNCSSFISTEDQPISSCYDSISNLNQKLYFGENTKGIDILLPSTSKIKLITTVDSLGEILKVKRLITVYKEGFAFLVSTSGSIYFRQLKAHNISRISKEHFIIEKNKFVGYYDLHSKAYLKAEYDSIQAYKAGLKFYKNGKVGFKKEFFYLNSIKGDRTVLFFPAIYDNINYFGSHYLVLGKGKQNILYHIKDKNIITKDFNPIAKPFCERYHKYKKGKKYGLCNVKGVPLTTPLYNKLLDSKHPDRIIYIKDKSYGFMDSKGVELTDNNFDKIYPFSEKGILPRTFTKYLRNKQFGLVSIDGDTITSPIFDNIRLISDDRAACLRADSSARIYILDKSTSKLDDWYEISHIKQLGINKTYSHAGTDNLSAEISPIDKNYFSHKIFNNKDFSDVKSQYNLTDYSNIQLTRIEDTQLFFNYILNDNSIAPNDELVCVLSINNGIRKGYRKYHPSKKTNNYYKSAQLFDNQYIKTINQEGKKAFLDVNLDPYSLSYKKEKLRVLNIEEGNSYYPKIFKVAGKRKTTNYMIPSKDYKKQFVPSGYNKVLLNDSTLFGRRGKYWHCVNNDSIELFNNTIHINTVDSLILSTEQNSSYYIYDEKGNEKLRFDSLRVVNQSSYGMILLQIDSIYNYLNPSGALILDTAVTEAFPFINNFANIKSNDKYDIINKQGKTVITAMNKKLLFNTKGVAVYYSNRKFGLIDTTGTPVDTASYIHYKSIKNTFLYQFKANKSDNFGLKNHEGKTIHKNLFDKIKKLDSNVFLATEKTNTYLLNAITGNILLKIKNGKVKPAGDNKYLINNGKKWGIYALNQEWILPLKYSSISKFNSSGYATFKKKKNAEYLLTDNSIVTVKPAKIRYIPKDNTLDSLIVNQDSVYVGINSINIPIRYNNIVQFNNGCYLATRYNQFMLHSFQGTEILYSDTWTDANIIDKSIMKVNTVKGLRYYNLTLNKWVWEH